MRKFEEVLPTPSSTRLSARKDLPQSYTLAWQFDIRQKREIIVLNLMGALLLVLSWIGFSALARWLRPDAAISGTTIASGNLGQLLFFIGIVILATVVMLVVHEGFHGLFFWLFSHTRPRFAFKVFYAYAAAPDWYFPRWQYILIGLAPLVGISLLGVAALAWLPMPWLVPTLLLLVFNTSGAVGDLWVVGRLLASPASTYIRDYGDKIEFYKPA